MPKVKFGHLFLAAAVTTVLALTLGPERGAEPQRFTLCIFCGSRGTADALLNVLLFLPVGLGLRLTGASWKRAILIGSLFSTGIELSQVLIPGRDPSIRDLVMNTLGTATGAQLAGRLGSWLAPSSALAARLSLVAACLPAAVVATTGALVQVSLPQVPYFAWSGYRLGRLEWYHGRVLSARIGPIALPHGPVPESGRVRELVLAGVPLDIQAIAGPPVPALGALFALVDGHYEMLLIGPDRDDLIIRFRTRSGSLGLDQPHLRIPGALRSVVAGDTLALHLWRQGERVCVRLNQNTHCDLGFTVSTGWQLLYGGEAMSARFREAVGILWLLGLSLPFGYWSRPARWSLVGAITLIASFALLPHAVDLLATQTWEWLAVGSGVSMGWLIRLVATTWAQRPARA